GSQALDHFPVDQQLAFAALYDGIAHRQTDIARASDTMERIQALTALGGNPQMMVELRADIGGLRQSIRALHFNAGYMKRHFDALEVKADSSDFAPDAALTHCNS